jgi:hypothetical protein
VRYDRRVFQTRTREAGDCETRAVLQAEVEQVRTFARDVALDGIRLEAVGLALVALGSTLSLVG